MTKEYANNYTSLAVSIIAILTAFSSAIFMLAEQHAENKVQNVRISSMAESMTKIENSTLRTNEKLEQIYMMLAKQKYAEKGGN